jgi:hypothetical protein
MTGNSPKDCIIVKAALYPPAWPTFIRKSRLLRLILNYLPSFQMAMSGEFGW